MATFWLKRNWFPKNTKKFTKSFTKKIFVNVKEIIVNRKNSKIVYLGYELGLGLVFGLGLGSSCRVSVPFLYLFLINQKYCYIDKMSKSPKVR